MDQIELKRGIKRDLLVIAGLNVLCWSLRITGKIQSSGPPITRALQPIRMSQYLARKKRKRRFFSCHVFLKS